ncbi:MAG: hypothetical protein R2549_06810, partial [Candidatus Scalindua sp.]|nr:hypothetical protein [Candidatus Scalindua sp.]
LTQMLKKNISIVLFILGVSLLTGCCFHGSYPPMLPSTWNGNEYDAKSLEDDSGQSKLHVMVMYHKTSCKHTALRLYCRTKGPLFWDPAGAFATQVRYLGPAARHNRDFATKRYMDSERRDDVISEKVPSLNQYLDWRRIINTHAVEIFKFNITDSEAEELYAILRYGTERSHPKGRFSTKAIGLTCGLSVAKFLHRFAEDIVEVDTVFFPHNLAKQLYNKDPDKVIIYRDEHLSFYIPSENHVE